MQLRPAFRAIPRAAETGRREEGPSGIAARCSRPMCWSILGVAKDPMPSPRPGGWTAGDSEIWPLLHKILALGCAASDEGLAIPSMTIQFEPEDDDDVFDKFVVISPAATLRKGPSRRARPIAKLAWDVVKAVTRAGRPDQSAVAGWPGRLALLRGALQPGLLPHVIAEPRREMDDHGVRRGRLTIASRRGVASYRLRALTQKRGRKWRDPRRKPPFPPQPSSRNPAAAAAQAL